MTPRQQSILTGAIVIGALSTSYLNYINNFCCLGIMIGGVVAVQQHASRTRSSVGAADGALLGMFAGISGAVLGLVFNLILRPLGLDLLSLSQESLQQTMRRMPSGASMMENMVKMLRDPGPALFGGVLFVRIVLDSIFGAIGGAIGAAIFGSDGQKQDAQPDGSQLSDSGSGESEIGGTKGGGAQPGLSDGPQDESAGGSESNREGSV
jgi:hypothetical protein